MQLILELDSIVFVLESGEVYQFDTTNKQVIFLLILLYLLVKNKNFTFHFIFKLT